jgi:ribosomal protein L12E/L44/L45/RPP1/RPP2
MDADTIDVVNRALKMIMQQINVEKDPQQRELLKKSTVDLGQISQWLQTKYARKGAQAMNEAKKVDPKKAAEDKKKADEKKKKEAEAKKKKMEEAKDTEKATPADLERAKKINNHYNKKAKDDYDNTTRMISLARAGKIGPAKTKK